MKEKQFSLAFDLVVKYAEAQGWIPIGHKIFTVGDWRIEVNGTKETIGRLHPYHALVENQKYMGAMVMHPYGGTVGGYRDTEKEFVDAMRAALATFPVWVVGGGKPADLPPSEVHEICPLKKE